MRICILLLLSTLGSAVSPGSPPPRKEPDLLVFCAPGYPGGTEEAQPTMDALAAGIATAAGWKPGSLAAVYHQDGAGGLGRLKEENAAVAVVTLPFFLEHRKELGLEPLLAGAPEGAGDGVWSLVAAKGKLRGAEDLAGWTVAGLPAYSPALVRGPILSGWGKIPATVNLSFHSRVLSSLRKAARGEKMAVLLDPVQVEALSSLPFGDQMEVVYRSGSFPVSLLCAVNGRLSEARRKDLLGAMRDLHLEPAGKKLLSSIRMERFEDLDPDRLKKIEEAMD